MTTEPMITVQNVADMLGVTACTVYRLKDKPGGLPAYKIGNRLRFKKEEVEEYIRRQAVKPAMKQEHPIKVHFHYVPGMKVV